MFIKRRQFQKKYVAFFAIVPLFLVTGLIQVVDPVCEGTGVIAAMPGMENVEITKTVSVEKTISRDACGSFIMYGYEITISALNSGDIDTEGWIKLTLIDFKRGMPLNQQYVVVNIPADSTFEATYSVWFTTGLNEPAKTRVEATPVVKDLPDETCNGTGKIPLNTWFLVNMQKDTFLELAQTVKPFQPPLQLFDNEEG